ncbi:hypothetical protein STK_00035 [Sulfurisphaera tokodaii str. 7]|uniref:Uncharacterized protein n=1 Tax=Sulfurisphaera tokodaii (strain DSM 16993 / JCM 10545 / NBRC 100140 / 7) TaxID=273063 RepID=Q977E3_SULTO|nr:hypothetical protein STK_00035 [Sulfurisphaera tokodaii str. 7]
MKACTPSLLRENFIELIVMLTPISLRSSRRDLTLSPSRQREQSLCILNIYELFYI